MSRQSDTHTRWPMAADGWDTHPEYLAAGWRMALAGATHERRSALGWTQAELAAAAGLPEDLVEEIECSSVDPTVPVLQALGRAFQADATLALTEDEPDLRFVPKVA